MSRVPQTSPTGSTVSALGRRWPPALIVTVVVGLIALTVFGVVGATRTDPGARVSFNGKTQRLAFTLPLFSGGQLSSTALRGKPMVVNFYASWCAICLQEMPDFERIQQDAHGQVSVVGVNPQSNDDDAGQAALVVHTGVTYPTVRDRNDALLRTFNTSGALPTTLFLDADGQVVRVYNGLLTEPKIARILAADFGVHLNTQTPDRSTFRTGPPTNPATSLPASAP